MLQADRELKVDRVDQAEAIYKAVSVADPSNAIAVTGLAQCALARGDDGRAHELASRALAIDPEDDMARRMEARLAEILTMRGETVTRPTTAATPSPREMRPMVTTTMTSDNPAATPAGPTPKRGLLARLRGH